MVTHVVTFKLAEASPDHLAHCRGRIEGLMGLVPALRSMTVGCNVVASPQAHDLVLIATFDDLEGLQAYQEHPRHQEVGQYLRSAATAVACVDFVS